MGRSSIRSRTGTTTRDVPFEQRRDRRAVCRQEAWVETPSREIVETYTTDVSDGGLGLWGAGVAVQVGDVVRVCLARPSPMDEGWIVVEVRWRSAERIGVAILSRRAT